jgi:hypothetical protein
MLSKVSRKKTRNAAMRNSHRNGSIVLFIIIALAANLLTAQDDENQKLAQTGFQFLSVGSDARAGALGEAMTTISMGAGALFFNPATMARMPMGVHVMASQNQWLADITHNSFAMALSPAGGRFGVLGLSLMNVNYGEFQGTMVAKNEQGFVDTEIFTPTAVSIGVGYARAISDRFSVGGHLKYANQDLGRSVLPVEDDSSTVKKNFASAVAFDFGTIYYTGFRSLAFGMSIRNYSNEIQFESESFQLPLTFRIGVSMNILDLIAPSMSSQSILLSVDASHPRSHSEQMNFGMEYKLLNAFSARAGYMLNYEIMGLTAGFGLQLAGLAIDYATTPSENLGMVERLTVRFGL